MTCIENPGFLYRFGARDRVHDNHTAPTISRQSVTRALKNGVGHTVYTPPQEPEIIVALMRDLERFINDGAVFNADPLIKMALIHHQFESMS